VQSLNLHLHAKLCQDQFILLPVKGKKKQILQHFQIQYPMVVPPSSVESTAIPAQSEKNTGHFAGHLIKNTGHLTGVQKPISLHLLGIIVSRQYSKSSDVGIYQARMLLPEIIVILLTQSAHFALLCTSATYF